MPPQPPAPLSQLPVLIKGLLLACLAGALAGSASALFLWGLDQVTGLRESHRWLVFSLPVLGFVTAWVYLRWGQSVEPGINLLIDEVQQEAQRPVPLRMAPLVLLSTWASHLGGASVGREGTAVQMGGALADQLSQRLRLDPRERRLLLLAGISAGFASVFGTPLAGAVFALELLVLGRLRHDALLVCTVAALVGDQVCTAWGAHHTHYTLGPVAPLGVGSVLAVVLAAVLFGLVARGFAQGTQWLGARFKQWVPDAPWRTALGGAVLAVLFWWGGAWRYAGLGIPVLVEAFQQPLSPWDFVGKMGFTVFSLAAGFKGGEVTPLFYIGATLGNALAPWLHMPMGMMAALGFVAVFAGAANTPLACTLMAMEVFGVEIGMYALLACSISFRVSGWSGIYRSQRVDPTPLGQDPSGWTLGQLSARPPSPPAPPDRDAR
ncbi:voltage-gated chloride channel family protein [Curvibacter sp. HBC61]|uniref:Voltage-gated chloride channel family protein n=1 Tax=Curvibacter cyanobacteriorum TaxID=3026422 RepID=A0ABT5MTN7_9BURK|nr:voltage-gated chloride channel family protein [Curvibacter sp. HBC61]MDD0837193.1 voltage-gated chloride channel family protein [Curvibacter sp. HBC61]